MPEKKNIEPDIYVEENLDTLVYIIKHSNDEFVRALALAAIVEFGDKPDQNTIAKELGRLNKSHNQDLSRWLKDE